MILIKKSKYKTQKWKNGFGLTEQIDASENQDWRLSLAIVS